MRTSPDHLAAVSDLARDRESGTFPCAILDGFAVGIATTHGVCAAHVAEDVETAARRRIEAEELPVRFQFTDEDGHEREIHVRDDDFFLVCLGGVQIGKACGTPQEAEKEIQAHLDDGVDAAEITVEAYHQGANDAEPVETTPFYREGRWRARTRAAA